jgi:hypothetical protein
LHINGPQAGTTVFTCGHTQIAVDRGNRAKVLRLYVGNMTESREDLEAIIGAIANWAENAIEGLPHHDC